jgi:hypothetical protein
VFKVGAVVGVSDASDTLCFNTLVYYFSTEVYTRRMASYIFILVHFSIEVPWKIFGAASGIVDAL